MQNNTKPWAVVTGTSSGIGAEFAKHLAIKGYNLVLVARRKDRLQDLAQILERQFNSQSLLVDLDLTTTGAVDELLRQIKTQDIQPQILINNAGVGSYQDFSVVSFAELNKMMTLNMTVLVELTHKLLPVLKKQSQSYVMNVASIAAFQPIPRFATYAATKSFVSFFTQALRYELKDSSVSVTTLYPGVTLTEFATRMGKDFTPFLKQISQTPEQVAKVALKKMFAQKRSCTPGFMNRLNAMLMNMIPQAIQIRLAGWAMRRFF